MEFCRAAEYEDQEESSLYYSSSSSRSSSDEFSSSDYEPRSTASPPFLLRSGTRLDQWLRFVDDGMQWKDVQLRFHRIASPAASSSPSIDASFFPYSIGMERSPKFAKELLAALRKRKNTNMNITETELQSHWIRITNPCYDSRLQVFFDMCDKDMKGRITRPNFKQMIILTASTNNLTLSREEAECYASLIKKELGAAQTGHSEAKMYPGEVLSLKMSRAKGFAYRSGMYIYIKCPQISLLEWHPFSLTSGPEDYYLSVHIRTLGDWSNQIYSLVQEAECSVPPCYPRVYIDGPYGAASQDHVKYDVVVLIGLGIGATPFISVLKDISSTLHRLSLNHDDIESGGVKGPVKAYLYWVTREQGSLGWLKEAIMKSLQRLVQNRE